MKYIKYAYSDYIYSKYDGSENKRLFNMKINEKFNINYEKESKLALPNELYTTIKQWKEDKKIKANQISFIWSYLYLQTYLYRYAKYAEYVPSVSEIKQMLGYAARSSSIEYIIKKDGLLDAEGWTESTDDFPVRIMWVDKDGDKTDRPIIITLKEESKGFHESLDGDVETIKQVLGTKSYEIHWKKVHYVNNKQKIKYPVFAFQRDLNPEYIDYDGTFYESANTTIIDIRIFEFCMSHEDLGCTGFYLYCYLKHKNDLHKGGYDASHKRLAEELGLSPKTIQTYRDALRSHRMMLLKHNMNSYHPSMKKESKKVSTNITYSFEQFKDNHIEYVKFGDEKKREKLELEHNVNKVLCDNLNNKPVHIYLSDLPF